LSLTRLAAGGHVTDASDIMIRGGLFSELKRFVKRQHSPELYKEVLAEIDPGYQKVFEGVIVASEFYPLLAYQEFLQAFRQRVKPEEFERSSSYLAEENLKGLFLVFARLLSKDFLIRKMTTMWGKIYTHGTISLLENTDERSGVVIEGIPLSQAHIIHSEVYIRTLLERATRQPHRSEAKIVGPDTTEFWFYPRA
jgi:hypothetical protein